MGDGAAADEVELDGSQGDLWRCLVDAMGAQIRDVTHASGLGKIEEGPYLVSELHSHDRRDQVEAIDPLQGGGMGSWIVPVEVDFGAGARPGTDAETALGECRG
jgi:hypothetical protein